VEDVREAIGTITEAASVCPPSTNGAATGGEVEK